MTSTTSQKEYLYPREAAEMLQITTGTLANYARAGLVPHMRTLGRQFRYNRDAIENLVLQMKSDNQKGRNNHE